jgi:hypothetical protein
MEPISDFLSHMACFVNHHHTSLFKWHKDFKENNYNTDIHDDIQHVPRFF